MVLESPYSNDAMDHKMADQQQTATKYLLNELTDDQRKEFEEHFFECPICADVVRQDFTISENLKAVVRDNKAVEPASFGMSSKAWWSQLFRPASLIPSLAAVALALVLVYQNGAFSRLTADKAQNQIEFLQEAPSSASVISPLARGSAETVVKVDRSESRFPLTFSVDGLANPEPLVCDFQKDSGSPVATFTTPPKKNDITLRLPVKLFPAGRYRMVMHASSEPSSQPFIYSFAIEDSK